MINIKDRAKPVKFETGCFENGKPIMAEIDKYGVYVYLKNKRFKYNVSWNEIMWVGIRKEVSKKDDQKEEK